jgi:hypothetical protein
MAVMAWGCYALLRVNYALFSMLITGYIALLFAFGGLPEPLVALDRIIATAIGGSVALAAHFLYIARPSAPRGQKGAAVSILKRSLLFSHSEHDLAAQMAALELVVKRPCGSDRRRRRRSLDPQFLSWHPDRHAGDLRAGCGAIRIGR